VVIGVHVDVLAHVASLPRVTINLSICERKRLNAVPAIRHCSSSAAAGRTPFLLISASSPQGYLAIDVRDRCFPE
jgi:hypothetical protein